ncbi:hypothetical protein ACFL7D_08840 [candidate division KSB1 bacterium]
MKNLFRIFTLFILSGIISTCFFSYGICGQNCSGCHPAFSDEPFYLPDTPPGDLISGQSTPCFDLSKIYEEWYYVEELFVTIEQHLVNLEEDRYHVVEIFDELKGSRDLYRETIKEPVVSLDNFILKSGKLRFDVGKVYREVKTHKIEQRDRDIFGIVVLSTLFVLFIIITGWRVASGNGEVNPRRTTLGYDELMEQEAKEKEAAE